MSGRGMDLGGLHNACLQEESWLELEMVMMGFERGADCMLYSILLLSCCLFIQCLSFHKNNLIITHFQLALVTLELVN